MCWRDGPFRVTGKPRLNAVCCPRVSGLVSLVQPAAEADGVEEAAVAQGLRVAAAELGHAALCELGAAGLCRAAFHFDRRGGQRDAGRSGSLFGLLRGKRAGRSFHVFMESAHAARPDKNTSCSSPKVTGECKFSQRSHVINQELDGRTELQGVPLNFNYSS